MPTITVKKVGFKVVHKVKNIPDYKTFLTQIGSLQKGVTAELENGGYVFLGGELFLNSSIEFKP